VNDLIPLAETIAARLKARNDSIAIAESSTGGLISAALLAVPGASAYFLGGAVTYTRQAKILLLGLDEAALTQFRSSTEPHALLLARGARARFGAAWGVAETGATGPTGNRYGDPAGHTWSCGCRHRRASCNARHRQRWAVRQYASLYCSRT
jgi:nicotinamide-nucleotide amidase